MIGPNTMMSSYEPCELIEHEQGQYSLTFTEFELYDDFFKQYGTESGGYAWEAIVKSRIELDRKKELYVEFDPESDMFAVYGSDLNSLKEIANIIRDLTKNTDKLKETINYASNAGYLRKSEALGKNLEMNNNFVGAVSVKGLGVLKVGSKVSHPKFGIGVVKNLEKNSTTRGKIEFKDYGSRWLVIEYANLSLVNE
jgi:hypothetical protein